MSFYSFSHGGITYLLLNLFLDTCFFMYMILNIHFLLLLYKTLFLYVNVESRDCIKLLLCYFICQHFARLFPVLARFMSFSCSALLTGNSSVLLSMHGDSGHRILFLISKGSSHPVTMNTYQGRQK